VRETENTETQIRKHCRFSCKCNSSHRLLHCYLRDGRQIVVGVVRHDNPAEEDGHYSRQMNAFCQCVGQVSEHQHHAKLQRGILAQLHMFQQVFNATDKIWSRRILSH